MELLNNLGISYCGSYINQGSLIDKCKKSEKLGIKNIELLLRNDGKDTDYNNISGLYTGNMILHAPAINTTLSNIKTIKEGINTLNSQNVKLITIDASTLLYETYDWSTAEEQQNYLKNMAKGIASLSNYRIPIAIENTTVLKNNLLFGKTASNISDLLVYVRDALVEEYDFTREDAYRFVGVSLNIGNLMDTDEIGSINNWLQVFYNDIMCLKLRDLDLILPLLDQIVDVFLKNDVDIPIILETTEELESINNVYNKLEFLMKNKLDNKPFNFDGYQELAKSRYNEFNNNFNTSQSGFTNAVIVSMIILTVIIAVLIILIQFR